jgi:hypothetical protein
LKFKCIVLNFFKITIFLIAVQAINARATACFDDESLREQLSASPSSLIYVWSPRMVLSVTQAHLAEEQASLLGLRFIPLVDGRIPSEEWKSALTKAAGVSKTSAEEVAVLGASQALCATSLIEKDAYLHFPTAFIVQNGILQPHKLVGAMPTYFWRKGMLARQVAEKAQEQCIAPNQFIRLDPNLAGLDDNKEVALGAYERISPDGRFVLRSYSGKRLTAVSVVELPGLQTGLATANLVTQTQRIFETPFSNEAFPVQGSWRYLVDTNGNHYEFSSILSNQIGAKPLFKAGMTGFYAAAAEVDSTYPALKKEVVRIRSLSWPNASGETDTQGEGMLTMRTLTIDPAQQRVLADSGRVNLCLDRTAIDGPMYALPMLAVNGHEFATLPQMPVAGEPTMRIFDLGADGQQCEPRAQFKSQSGKVIFGYPDKQKGTFADVAYEYRGQIWWYQRTAAMPFNLAPWEDVPVLGSSVTYQNILASAFPGITRDGRVIYAATWKRCKGQVCEPEGGYVVADPWQSNAYKTHLMQNPGKGGAGKSCITVQDVARERADFAAFHGISN